MFGETPKFMTHSYSNTNVGRYFVRHNKNCTKELLWKVTPYSDRLEWKNGTHQHSYTTELDSSLVLSLPHPVSPVPPPPSSSWQLTVQNKYSWCTHCLLSRNFQKACWERTVTLYSSTLLHLEKSSNSFEPSKGCESLGYRGWSEQHGSDCVEWAR